MSRQAADIKQSPLSERRTGAGDPFRDAADSCSRLYFLPMPPRDFDALDGIRHQEVSDAVLNGRAVTDPELAAIAVDRARHLRRAIMRLLTVLAALALVGGVSVHRFGDEGHWDAFVALGIIFGALIGVFHLYLYASVVRAEKENNALLGVGQGAGPPTLAERLGAAGLALFAGLLASRLGGLVLYVAARIAGQEVDQLPWIWNVPLALIGLAVAWLVYRVILSRAED